MASCPAVICASARWRSRVGSSRAAGRARRKPSACPNMRKRSRRAGQRAQPRAQDPMPPPIRGPRGRSRSRRRARSRALPRTVDSQLLSSDVREAPRSGEDGALRAASSSPASARSSQAYSRTVSSSRYRVRPLCSRRRDERLLHQAREHVEREPWRDRRRRLRIEPAGEHGQAAKGPPARSIKKLIAPLDRGTHRPVVRR